MLEHEFLIRFHSLNALLNRKVTFNHNEKVETGKLLMILGGPAELFCIIAQESELVYIDTEKTPIFGIANVILPPVIDPPTNLPA